VCFDDEINMRKQVEIKLASTSDFDRVQEFYQKVGYMQLIQTTDIVVLAVVDNRIVGISRIANENDILVLRGMQVDRSLLRQGIGSLMLAKLNDVIGNAECYCIPHDWLEGFYEQIGFEAISFKKAPPHLKKRIENYFPKYPHLIMMGKNI